MIKQYTKYKDSEIHWLDEVPEHWTVKRIKDVAKKMGSGVTPKGGSESYKSTGITFLRSQNVYDIGLKLDNVSFIDIETHQKMQNSQIKPLDILINITGASIGRSCIVPDSLEEANINQHILYIRTSKELVPFISLYIKSNLIKDYINLIQSGSSREGLSMGETRQFSIPLPPIQEQIQIATYLEQKTTAIDKKTTLLEQKIEYYKTLRKSLINETITRGLDKNVKLKDSGIKWIGEIPEHWEVKRIKDLFRISRGRVIGKGELKDNGKYPVYSSQTQNQGILGYIDTYDFKDELLTWTTDGVNAGTVFKREGKFNCTNICGTLTPKRSNKISLDYMCESVQESAKHNKRIDTNGAKIMSNEMAVIRVVHPSFEEQKQIADYLETKTQIIDNIIDNIKDQITTLKELRKTLINDVVTGKIKVTA